MPGQRMVNNGVAELGEGVFTLRLNGANGLIVAVVAVKLPAQVVAANPAYSREYWDVVTDVGGTEAAYAEFTNSILAGGGMQTLFATKASGWTWHPDEHPPFPILGLPGVPPRASGTELTRWFASPIVIAKHRAP